MTNFVSNEYQSILKILNRFLQRILIEQLPTYIVENKKTYIV